MNKPAHRSNDRQIRPRTVAVLAGITTLSTYLWIGLTVADTLSAGPLDSFESRVTHAASGSPLYMLNYTNAALITVLAMLFYGALYLFLSNNLGELERLSIFFLPVYGTLNLFSYLAQITAVPALVAWRPTFGTAVDPVLALLLHLHPGSLVGMLNALAYALLGLPSLAFGAALWRLGKLLRAGGALLALNGVAALIGFVGTAAGLPALAQGVGVSGALFALALIPLTAGFWQLEKTTTARRPGSNA